MRTDAEVTAAAERTADLALKCARLERERDETREDRNEWQRAWRRLEQQTGDLIHERDRARDIAVALEGQLAAVRAQADEWERVGGPSRIAFLVAADEIRAALDPDPADRGTGRDGEGS